MSSVRRSARLTRAASDSISERTVVPGKNPVDATTKKSRKMDDSFLQDRLMKIGRQRKAICRIDQSNGAIAAAEPRTGSGDAHGSQMLRKKAMQHEVKMEELFADVKPEVPESKVKIESGDKADADVEAKQQLDISLKKEDPWRKTETKDVEPLGGSILPRSEWKTLYRVRPDPLIECIFLRRPSVRNKSPYVGDVQLACGKQAIGHFPSMELGGKCVPGTTVYVKPARDPKGKLVGPNAVSPKYGTPKCEYICQLVRNLEPENSPEGCLIGAHPRLGEMAVEALLKVGTTFHPLSPSPIVTVQKEVHNIAGCDMRADFLLEFEDGTAAVVEVKTVVDTDYAPKTAPVLSKGEKRCIFIGPDTAENPYRRAAIFPWGGCNQKLDGWKKGDQKVVSTRAIRHVQELTRIAKGDRTDANYPDLFAAVIFVIARSDAVYFRPNHDACPIFAETALEARDAGVKFLAPVVSFELSQTDGTCSAVHRGQIPIDWEQIPVASEMDSNSYDT